MAQSQIISGSREVLAVNQTVLDTLTWVHSDVIETCLFVLWRHLEYYLMYCTPSDPKNALLPGASSFRSRFADGKKSLGMDQRLTRGPRGQTGLLLEFPWNNTIIMLVCD